MPELIPVRMLNEFVYCPRLFHLEWVQGEWAESADTVRGSAVHARVDRPSSTSWQEPPRTVRSLHLGSDRLGLVAKIDLVEAENDGSLVPVDYKKGRVPRSGPWDPERVQVCAQGLLLREHGWSVDHGVLYFAASRRRVMVPFDDVLVELTLRSLDAARACAESGELPPPLVDDPRCPRCSLVGICLPDETNQLLGRSQEVRPLVPSRDDGMPLYVQLQGGSLRKDHDEIVIRERGTEIGRVRMMETSRVVVLGNVTVTTPLLNALAERDVPVSYHSYGGWFNGMFTPSSGLNVGLRIAQHRAADDPEAALALARAIVRGKILNQRVMLRRNASGLAAEVLPAMKDLAEQATRARELLVLLGLEGMAARHYYQSFALMIRSEELTFRFEERNRRPPRDPVNSMLSFGYACLVREVTNILQGMGFDAFVGFLHQPRPGRPALALDLMEEFRPIVADSAVLSAINNGSLREEHFVCRPTGVTMTRDGKRKLIRALERRLDEEVTHPLFGTRWSYRRIIEVQARLMSRVLLGELAVYPAFRVR